MSSLISVHTAWVSSPWRSTRLAASATFAPALPSWFGTATAVADTRNTATTTASALSPPPSFRLRNSPIVSLSSWATFCKCRLALARCARFALAVHAGHLTGGFALAE